MVLNENKVVRREVLRGRTKRDTDTVPDTSLNLREPKTKVNGFVT